MLPYELRTRLRSISYFPFLDHCSISPHQRPPPSLPHHLRFLYISNLKAGFCYYLYYSSAQYPIYLQI